MSRKILTQVPNEQVMSDLEKYRQRAIELGAEDAKIITTDDVLIDERVRAKCMVPKCDYYGTNANCPPYAIDLDLARRIVNKFHYGILIWSTISAEAITGHDEGAKKIRGSTQKKNHERVSKIEAEAFYDGYPFALGLANGSCKHLFCKDTVCSALTPGKGCSHPLKARSSMEGWGMNAYLMAARAGWDIYPVGASTKPSDVAHGARVGLVLIY